MRRHTSPSASAHVDESPSEHVSRRISVGAACRLSSYDGGVGAGGRKRGRGLCGAGLLRTLPFVVRRRRFVAVGGGRRSNAVVGGGGGLATSDGVVVVVLGVVVVGVVGGVVVEVVEVFSGRDAEILYCAVDNAGSDTGFDDVVVIVVVVVVAIDDEVVL